MSAKYLKSTAVRNYPPGTRFLSIHTDGIPKHEVIVKDFWHTDDKGDIWFMGLENNGVVYHNGKWAPITLDVKNISEEYREAKLELLETFSKAMDELEEALNNIE